MGAATWPPLPPLSTRTMTTTSGSFTGANDANHAWSCPFSAFDFEIIWAVPVLPATSRPAIRAPAPVPPPPLPHALVDQPPPSALAQREPSVWAAAGIHPHEATASAEGDLGQIEALAGSPRVVAIGEIGLDFHYDHSPRDRQQSLFRRQLDLADRLRLPAVIHSRDADEATLAILSSWSPQRRSLGLPEPFGVMHCYAYGPERLRAYTDLGLYISLPGIVTYPKAEAVQQTAARVEAGVLLVETDCPYLAPQSRRGRRNEPSLLTETAARVASLRGVTVEALARQSTANARRLYDLPAQLAPAQQQSARGEGTSRRQEP